MNMIPCGEACRFQEDGYCQLPPQSKASGAGADQGVNCVYYQPLIPQDPDRFRNP